MVKLKKVEVMNMNMNMNNVIEKAKELDQYNNDLPDVEVGGGNNPG